MYTKKIIIVLYSILSFSLTADYYVKEQKIYYEGYDHKNGKFINYDDEVKNIDLDSFEQLNPFYARDNNTVYFRGKETDIDRNSIKIIRLNLVKDKNFVYYGDKKLKVSPKNFLFVNRKVSNESIPTVHAGSIFYVKDSQNAYHVEVDKDGNIKETKLDNADVGKLVSWNGILAKDEKSVYRYGEKIDYIDAVSFNGDGIGYGKDKNNWYYGVTKIKNADYKSFKEIKGSLTFAKDKYNVFYKEKIIEGADKKTFEPMEGKFSKDKFGFFYKEQRLEGVSYEDIKDLMKASRIDDKKVPGYKYKE